MAKRNSPDTIENKRKAWQVDEPARLIKGFT